MPKYSVEDVLDIIRTLTVEEKSLLKAQLPVILDTSPSMGNSQNLNANSQAQTFGNVSVGGGGSFQNNQVKSGGNTNLDQSNSHIKAKNASLDEALDLLRKIKLQVISNSDLDALTKKIAESQIEVAESELQKPSPDKNLIDRAIEGLKKGFEGVIVLAEPVRKVAELIAQAWISL